jgi:phosphoribosylformylglycinamidine synthase
MRFEAVVEVMLRPGIADPQGATVERALPVLGFSGIDGVRIGKAVRLFVDAESPEAARQQVTLVTERLLANPVIEDATVRLVDPAEEVSTPVAP